jgi:hypothetical protein
MNKEFQDKYAGRYYGKYRARVTNPTGDPKKLGRVKTVCPVVLGEEELGWALPSPSYGGGVNTGQLKLPLTGDYVWVEFEEGDPSQPIWSHGPWGIRSGQSTVPRHSRGEPDSTDYSRREYGNIPPTQFQGQYGNVEFMGYRDGSFMEIDSTPGAGRLQLSHFTGSRLEMTYDGSVQEVAVQSCRKQVGENHSVQVIGREDYSVGNDRKVIVAGNLNNEVAGNVVDSYFNKVETGQSINRVLAGNFDNVVGGNWRQKCLAQAQFNVGGQLGFQCAQNIQMSASEYIELIGMNSNWATTLSSTAATLQGYQGDTILQGTWVDPVASQYISNAFVHLSPNVNPLLAKTTIGVSASPAEIPAGIIELNGDPLKNIKLGADSAVAQAMNGTAFNTLYKIYMTGMLAFFAAVAGDAVLKAVAPATSAAAIAMQPIVNTFNIAVQSDAYLSQFVYLK